MEVAEQDIQPFPKPECCFDVHKFLIKCQNEYPNLINQATRLTPNQHAFAWLHLLSHNYPDTINWAMANIARAKLFLTTDEIPNNTYGPEVQNHNKAFHVFLIDRLNDYVLPWLELNHPSSKELKWCKIQLGFLYREYALIYYSDTPDKRTKHLDNAYKSFLQEYKRNTTKTVSYCLASLILHDNYKPAGMTRDQATEIARSYLGIAAVKQSARPHGIISGSRSTALQIAAHPVYVRELGDDQAVASEVSSEEGGDESLEHSYTMDIDHENSSNDSDSNYDNFDSDYEPGDESSDDSDLMDMDVDNDSWSYDSDSDNED